MVGQSETRTELEAQFCPSLRASKYGNHQAEEGTVVGVTRYKNWTSVIGQDGESIESGPHHCAVFESKEVRNVLAHPSMHTSFIRCLCYAVAYFHCSP